MKNSIKFSQFLKDISIVLEGKPTVQKVLALMYVYQNEPCTTSEIQRYLKTTMGGTSKLIHDMTSITSRKKPGIGILEARQDTMNLKSVNITTSSLGKKILKPIFDKLED